MLNKMIKEMKLKSTIIISNPHTDCTVPVSLVGFRSSNGTWTPRRISIQGTFIVVGKKKQIWLRGQSNFHDARVRASQKFHVTQSIFIFGINYHFLL